MLELYLTAYNGKILGPIAKGLGWCMDKIYVLMYHVFGISNIALSIIIFTIVIYMCLLPITYRQQKFSMLSRKMQPEIQAVQKKYKNKRDQASMQAMQEETQQVYDKYGISPSGSCIQAVIQIPLLFALYRVFNNVPAYISSVKGIFTNLVNGIVKTDGYLSAMNKIYKNANLRNVQVDFTASDLTTADAKNYIIDVLYKLTDNGWNSVSKAFPKLSVLVATTHANLNSVNYFGILNISATPWNIMKQGFSEHAPLLFICALLIPLVSYATQMINIKMMPTTSASDNDQMEKQMRTMNMMMPLMSLFFAFTLPVGLGIYWITGSVIRIIQQFFLNRHFNKIDLDDIIEKNKEKAEKKKEKRGLRAQQIAQAATINTRKSLSSRADISSANEESIEKAHQAAAKANPNSLTAKANMVSDFNNRNSKK